MTVRNDVEAERAMLADSLELVGPGAGAGCGDWTAFDLAAHVVAADRAAGVPAFCIRTLADRGVQFRPQPRLVNRVIGRERRDGYPALVRRLRQRPPLLLLATPVAASSLFEVWMHHDDLAAANDLPRSAPEHLGAAIPSLVRYQAQRLPTAQLVIRTTENCEWVFGPEGGPRAELTGHTADFVRWRAGRQPMGALTINAEAAVAAELHRFVGTI